MSTLNPQTVANALIREVRRLIDVQAAVVLVPDAAGHLRVLASAGRSPASTGPCICARTTAACPRCARCAKGARCR